MPTWVEALARKALVESEHITCCSNCRAKAAIEAVIRETVERCAQLGEARCLCPSNVACETRDAIRKLLTAPTDEPL